jgi:hydrogenase-4 membrane subunit HyfE
MKTRCESATCATHTRLLHAGPFLAFLFVSAQFIEENCTLNAKLSVIVDSLLRDKILRIHEFVEKNKF